MKYITIKEYNLKYGISKVAIYEAVKQGKLLSRKRGNLIVVEDKSYQKNDDDTEENDISNNNRSKLNTAFQIAKIQKLQADIEYQKQRIESRKEEYLIEYTEQIIEAYTDAFATLKNELINMRLNNEQIAVLQDLISRCNRNFITKLRRLKGKTEDAEE